MSRNNRRRPLSAGTVFMLGLLVLVLAGSAVVLARLSSGGSVDLDKLKMQILDLQSANRDGGEEGTQPAAAQAREKEAPGFPGTGTGTAAAAQPAPDGGSENPPAEPQQAAESQAESQPSSQGKAASGQASPGQAPAGSGTSGQPAGETTENRSFRLTAAGSVCLEGEVLKNSWNPEAKIYDLADMMLLLKPELSGDLNTLFLENIISGSEKANDTVAPEELADLLRETGFGLAAGGFSRAYDKGTEGVAATWMALDERGVVPAGIRPAERQDRLEIVTAGGVKAAFLQYTGTVPSKTRKKMVKADASRTVPEAEISLITEEITAARKQGAEAVIVMLKWGKTDSKPDSSQRELAGQIAKAGADLIIGSGSRIPQGAEYLDGQDGRKVLCVWSNGVLMTGDRSNTKHMSGYLLHVTVKADGRGGADILAPEYTPVYTWKYRQDGRYYYRCLASDQPAPDGMDGEQQKNMAKAAKTVSEILAGSPLAPRER